MTLKILQLNIWQGAFLPEIIEFVKKENFDILHFQEVTGGELSRGGSNRELHSSTFVPSIKAINVGIDCFAILQTQLSEYKGYNVPTWNITGDKKSYHGIASFVKKSLPMVKTETIWLRGFQEYSDQSTVDIERMPRAAICIQLETLHTPLFLINTHAAWGPNDRDTPIKIAQAKILSDYIQMLDGKIILTGDFNVSPDTLTAKAYEDSGENLILRYGITNTLNPNTHHAKQLFPKGLAVDFIFVPKNSIAKQFRVIDNIDLSDHFGLMAEVEITS